MHHRAHVFGGIVFGLMLTAVFWRLFPGAYDGEWGLAIHYGTVAALSYGAYRALNWAERRLKA